jgi:hypothetical protein
MNQPIILSKKALRYLRRLVKDEIKGYVPEDVTNELWRLGVKIQTESERHGRAWDTYSYIMEGMEDAKLLVQITKGPK